MYECQLHTKLSAVFWRDRFCTAPAADHKGISLASCERDRLADAFIGLWIPCDGKGLACGHSTRSICIYNTITGT